MTIGQLRLGQLRLGRRRRDRLVRRQSTLRPGRMGIPGPGVLELGLGLVEQAGALPAAAVARTRQVSIIAVASGVVRFPAMSQGLLPGQQILIGRRDIARAIQVDRGL